MKLYLLFTAIITILSYSMSAVGGTSYRTCLNQGDKMLPGDDLWSPNGEWAFKIDEQGDLAILDATNNWARAWNFDPSEKIVKINVSQQGLYLYKAGARNGTINFHQFPTRSQREDLFDKDQRCPR